MSSESSPTPANLLSVAPAEVMPAEKPVVRPEPTYFNRELSWLEFNARVLEEAAAHDTPLLEKLKFPKPHTL